MYSIWRSGRAEWEAWAVTREDGGARPATPQELLDRNVVLAGVDPVRDEAVFHVLSLSWEPGDYPGRPIGAGPAERRFARLARETREVATRVRVERAGGRRPREMLVHPGEVRETDRVLERGVIPFRVLGEP